MNDICQVWVKNIITKMNIKHLVSFILMISLISCADYESDRADRVNYQRKAETWLQENKIQGIVSCNQFVNYYCDVVSSDLRSPFMLSCDGKHCVLFHD